MTPKARNAYTVGRTAPKSPLAPLERCHTIAAAASPQREEIVREPGATSSRALHCGHSMLLENAAAFAAEISVLQCGQIRTATAHLSIQTPYNKRNDARMKRESSERRHSVYLERHAQVRGWSPTRVVGQLGAPRTRQLAVEEMKPQSFTRGLCFNELLYAAEEVPSGRECCERCLPARCRRAF